ncbi:MAG: hypothetical protein RL441_488 [Actinomycetota bacterium]
MTAQLTLIARLKRAMPEVSKFLTVGAVAYVVDVGLFNLLRFAGEGAVLAEKPITAKAISTVAAILVAYFGNRTWTYGDRAGHHFSKELVLFFVVNGVAMLLSLGCLALSHYVLGFDSALADNISANIVGIGLGTLFRFFMYRRFVFVH